MKGYFLAWGLIMYFPLWAQSKPQINVLPQQGDPTHFEHDHKGCPANSECDQVMGQQLSQWNDLTNKLKSSDLLEDKKAQELEAHRTKFGIPIEFYTRQKSNQGMKPIIFDSACKNHTPKNEKDKELKTLIGISFVKMINKTKAHIWRDQALIEVPLSELFIPQNIVVYYPEGAIEYQTALNDQPSYIKNKELFILKEDNDLFFTLKISSQGIWKIVPSDFSLTQEMSEKTSEATCPKDDKFTTPADFSVTFCRSIWDVSTKRPVIVRLLKGCAT